MKRFLLFACDQYYPLGGFDDFVKDFGTLEEAKDWALITRGDSAHIVDTYTRERFDRNSIIFNTSKV